LLRAILDLRDLTRKVTLWISFRSRLRRAKHRPFSQIITWLRSAIPVATVEEVLQTYNEDGSYELL
jgi:hypothetical protein